MRPWYFQTSFGMHVVGSLIHNSRSIHETTEQQWMLTQWHRSSHRKANQRIPVLVLSSLKCKNTLHWETRKLCESTLQRFLWILTSITDGYQSMWFILWHLWVQNSFNRGQKNPSPFQFSTDAVTRYNVSQTTDRLALSSIQDMWRHVTDVKCFRLYEECDFCENMFESNKYT